MKNNKKVCPNCDGVRVFDGSEGWREVCSLCDGDGYVDKDYDMGYDDGLLEGRIKCEEAIENYMQAHFKVLTIDQKFIFDRALKIISDCFDKEVQ